MIPLDQVPAGKKARIVHLQAPGRWNQRLPQMGFVPGNIVEVVINRGCGPIVVRVLGVTISLGRGIAKRIYVEPIK